MLFKNIIGQNTTKIKCTEKKNISSKRAVMKNILQNWY